MSERPEFQNPQNWHSRGYLPHYDAAGKYQMITYRLADSLPKEVLGARASSPQSSAKERMEIEEYLDKGYGSCVLKDPQNAQTVVDAWNFFDKKRYDLLAYVVMPNHVHLLVKTYKCFPLRSLIHSWKSFTSNEINKYLEANAGRMPALPAVWQEDYWDRFIRDGNHFKSAVKYILENPVKAGLVDKWQDWRWSFSAYYQSALPEKGQG
ncbi:MAG: transposase [Lentisphaeraceae bacterium]|nr:transposase [Lentisphaeraceae bacterium]